MPHQKSSQNGEKKIKIGRHQEKEKETERVWERCYKDSGKGMEDFIFPCGKRSKAMLPAHGKGEAKRTPCQIQCSGADRI